MYKAMQVFFIHSYKSINPEGTAIIYDFTVYRKLFPDLFIFFFQIKEMPRTLLNFSSLNTSLLFLYFERGDASLQEAPN